MDCVVTPLKTLMGFSVHLNVQFKFYNLPNFKIFAVVFVSYFLLMDIHWWETLGTILIYMGIK